MLHQPHNLIFRQCQLDVKDAKARKCQRHAHANVDGHEHSDGGAWWQPIVRDGYVPAGKSWSVFRGNEAAIQAHVTERADAQQLAAEAFEMVTPAKSVEEWKKRYPDWQQISRLRVEGLGFGV